MTDSTCPICDQLTGEQAAAREATGPSALVAALPDRHPHAVGHTLVVPRRHVGRLVDLTSEEHRALFDLAREVLVDLGERHAPDAFTLGINDGPAAGQSVPHVHLHVVPRRHGDVDSPKGGIRKSLPSPLEG